MAATALAGTGNLVTVTAGSANNVALPKPGNTSDGDYLVAFVYLRNGGGTITTPGAEWGVLATINTVDETFAAYVKKIPSAAAETATSYTFSNSAGSSRAVGHIFRVIGADQTTFQHAYGAQANHTGSTSVTLPAVTTTGGNKLLLAFAINNNTTTGTASLFTAPAGMTTLVQATADNGTSATATTWVGQEVIAAAGSTGTRVPTISPAAANVGGFMVAVNSSNTPPTVAAIADQIKAAGAGATVTAVPTDVDGTISSHLWTVEKAPFGTTAPSLTNATTATVTVGALSVGTTILKYIATDNSGLQSTPVYARLLVPAASSVPVKASRLKSNGGGWITGGTATDLVDGVSGSGKWILSPTGPTSAEITFEMEVPSNGTHTISFYADWVESDGTTQASGVTGSFVAQAFRNGVAISDMYSGSNVTSAPVQLTFSMNTADNSAMNSDLTKIDIRLTATQSGGSFGITAIFPDTGIYPDTGQFARI